jgi:hypothetical protein
MEEIDAIVKPLIDSAFEDAGALLGGAAKVLGVAGMAADFLLDAPATARDEDMLNKAKGIPPDAVKLEKGQGDRDKSGNTWRKDKLHKDHWDVIDRKGRKIREVTFDGRQLWPGGPKNNQ